MVRIGVLTSSRADFGVYLPLLKAFRDDEYIHCEIIAFGTHLSTNHGYTINEIKDSGFDVKYTISSILDKDNEEAIATSAANTSLKFSTFWAGNKNKFDIVFCLGDRFEMFAAVLAGVPFGVKFAHLYGGDHSFGAIDNVYRDCITHASFFHFPSTIKCAERVKQLKEANDKIIPVGILSIEDIESMELLSINEFNKKWKVNLEIPTILTTIHPETIEAHNNVNYSMIIKEVIEQLQQQYQVIITMPNADTNGSIYRNIYSEVKIKFPERVFLFENLGIKSYFSCMKHSILMIGNTSSGLSEAPTFNKYFINIGNRQKGREFGGNVINVDFNVDRILESIKTAISHGKYTGINIYKQDGAIKKIISAVKSYVNI